MKKVRDRIYYTRYFIAFASGIFFCLVNCVLLFILKFLCQADVMLCTLWEKILQGFFFFPYFPENVVLQLLASCIHKQRTDATTFNSSLDPLSPRGRDFFFLKDTICERFNVISTWNLSYVYITKPSSSSDSASVNEQNMKSLAHNSFS